MGEVIRFISKSERERARLIREARATYDSIFPPVDSVSEQLDKAPSGANAHRSEVFCRDSPIVGQRIHHFGPGKTHLCPIDAVRTTPAACQGVLKGYTDERADQRVRT